MMWKNVTFEPMLQIELISTFCGIAFRLMPRNTLDGKSNIGLGNGLVPSGTKPLPKPMLTQIYITIWHHLATMRWKVNFIIQLADFQLTLTEKKKLLTVYVLRTSMRTKDLMGVHHDTRRIHWQAMLGFHIVLLFTVGHWVQTPRWYCC